MISTRCFLLIINMRHGIVTAIGRSREAAVREAADVITIAAGIELFALILLIFVVTVVAGTVSYSSFFLFRRRLERRSVQNILFPVAVWQKSTDGERFFFISCHLCNITQQPIRNKVNSTHDNYYR